jgi:uncharacterized protein YceH (UPF0502 family)
VELTPEQVRVLGCLVEKERTTPDQYPLSTNALVAACNQRSNRDPVVSLDDRSVDQAMLELRQIGLARTVRPTGTRGHKHRHVLDEAWRLEHDELAVLAVLMLRGAQTPGELRARTERYGELDMPAVEAVLGRLADHDPPLATNLGRRPGQSQDRWTHLLSGTEPAAAGSTWSPPTPAAAGSTWSPPPPAAAGSAGTGPLPAVGSAAAGATDLGARVAGLEETVARLEGSVARLEEAVAGLRAELGL